MKGKFRGIVVLAILLGLAGCIRLNGQTPSEASLRSTRRNGLMPPFLISSLFRLNAASLIDSSTERNAQNFRDPKLDSNTQVSKVEESSAKPNELTAQEKQAGWKLLFDGQSGKGWRSFKKSSFPAKGWVAEDGWLKCLKRGGGGDIISDQQFDDFELQWEWQIPPRANNGLKYFVTEQRTSAIGHEYQMIDDAVVRGHSKGVTASFYDVLPPSRKTSLRPPGETNLSRILVRGGHVEHWLNGEKVLEYELGSPAVAAAVGQSKFKDVAGFGTKIRGHILLTDHRDEAWYRNIKIREVK